MSTKYYVIKKEEYENLLRVSANMEDVLINNNLEGMIEGFLSFIKEAKVDRMVFCAKTTYGWKVHWTPNKVFCNYQEFILMDRDDYVFVDECDDMWTYDQFESKMLYHDAQSVNGRVSFDSMIDKVGFCWMEEE